MDAQLIDKLELRSLWPDAIPEPVGPVLEGYAVDLGKETIWSVRLTPKIDKTTALRRAKAVQRGCRGSRIRHFVYSNQQLHDEDAVNRDNYRWDHRTGGPPGQQTGQGGGKSVLMVRHIRRRKVAPCQSEESINS